MNIFIVLLFMIFNIRDSKIRHSGKFNENAVVEAVADNIMDNDNGDDGHRDIRETVTNSIQGDCCSSSSASTNVAFAIESLVKIHRIFDI